MEFIDLLGPSQDAVFARLKEGVPAAIATVHQHVKQDTQPPYIVIGAIDSDNGAAKGGQTEQISVDIHFVHRGTSRAPLFTMMHAARRALEGQPLVAEGVEFETPNWLGSSGTTAGPDGVTYAGLSQYEFFAEPA